jgi:hypothetical protein
MNTEINYNSEENNKEEINPVEAPNESTLKTFFIDILEQYKTNTLTFDQHKLLGEFYIAWKFNDRQKCKSKRQSRSKYQDDISQDDFQKFMTLGWYVYSTLNTNS